MNEDKLTAQTLDSVAEDITGILDLADGMASMLFVLCRTAKENAGDAEISSALYAAAHLATCITDELTGTVHSIDLPLKEG
ncbi:MAG: hypothetical protein IJT94_10755 [Oscillibacter sp.]|nr:hypothetical protein [Oscillibacter sp.]